ncbi:MAG TPA: hypothetical protein VI935_08795 [Thermodesulfobacteriota bacterium]|nr:hypothetical protein [Thermodesulfobacteriota bacterium]
MERPDNFIGVNLSSVSLTVSVRTHPWRVVDPPTSFENSADGFCNLLAWLHKHSHKPDNSVVCMEATGSCQ